MVSTTLLRQDVISVVDRRCDAGPNAPPVHELHNDFSISFVRKGSFGYRSGGKSFDLSLLVPPRRVAGGAADARTCEAARLRRRLREKSVSSRSRRQDYSVLMTSAGHARASTRSCHSLILPSRSITTPTRCAPFWGSTFAP